MMLPRYLITVARQYSSWGILEHRTGGDSSVSWSGKFWRGH